VDPIFSDDRSLFAWRFWPAFLSQIIRGAAQLSLSSLHRDYNDDNDNNDSVGMLLGGQRTQQPTIDGSGEGDG
jgi:hypothetical protein